MRHEEDPVLTVHEAAAYVRMHPQTVRKAAREREVTCMKRGRYGRMRFRRSALDAWLRTFEVKARRSP